MSGGCSSHFRSFCTRGQCVTPTCADVVPHCSDRDSDAGRFARRYCPATCGCDIPTSTQIWISPFDGCPVSCIAKRDKQMALQPCADAEVGSAGIVAYAQAWIDYGKASGDESLVMTGQSILSGGCQSPIVQAIGTEVMCKASTLVSSEGKTLWPFCPVTCGCQGGEPGCPATCPATSTSPATGNGTSVHAFTEPNRRGL